MVGNMEGPRASRVLTPNCYHLLLTRADAVMIFDNRECSATNFCQLCCVDFKAILRYLILYAFAKEDFFRNSFCRNGIAFEEMGKATYLFI